MNIYKVTYLVVSFFIATSAQAVFDPVAVKAKINALKNQMVKVATAQAAEAAARTTFSLVTLPYRPYALQSVVVTNCIRFIDSPLQSSAGIKTFSDATFDQAYAAYFSFNAQQMIKDITDALGGLKSAATTISSLIDKRMAAQNPFKEIVTGVAKPAFLGS